MALPCVMERANRDLFHYLEIVLKSHSSQRIIFFFFLKEIVARSSGLSRWIRSLIDEASIAIKRTIKERREKGKFRIQKLEDLHFMLFCSFFVSFSQHGWKKYVYDYILPFKWSSYSFDKSVVRLEIGQTFVFHKLSSPIC